MNLKILKYNLYLMATLSALVWGFEKNPEITEELKEYAKPAISLLKTHAPVAYRALASITSEEVEAIEDKGSKLASIKETKDPVLKEEVKKQNEVVAKKIVNDEYEEMEVAANNLNINPMKAEDRKNVFSGTGYAGRGSSGGAAPLAANTTGNKAATPTKAGIATVTAPVVTPLVLVCAADQDKLNDVCITHPKISPIPSVKIKTTKNVLVPLTLSDNRYTCDNLLFSFDAAYLTVSDLTIIKENDLCFLKIAPSLNSAGVSQLKVKLNHNGNNIEEIFDLELVALISATLESFHNIVPKDLEFSFIVKAVYSDGSTENIAQDLTWTSSSPAVIENLNKEVFKAKTVGQSNLSSSVKEFSLSKSLEIQDWNNMFLSDYYIKGALNSIIQLKAFVYLTNGSIFDLTKYIPWLSYQEELLEINKGKADLKDSGLAKIDSFFGTQQKTAFIDIGTKRLVSVDINGASLLTPWAQSQYKVIAYYDDNSSQDITSQVDLSVADATIAKIENNKVLALSLGQTKLTLDIGEQSFEKEITVDLNQLTALKISPENYLAYKNQKIKYKVLGVYANGQEFDLTTQAAYSISNLVALNFNANELSVINATNSFSSDTVTAAYQGINTTTKITYNPAIISSTAIIMSGNLAVGNNYKLQVLGYLNDGGVVDLTSVAKFSSNNEAVVSVSNSTFNQGKVYGMSMGSATISAEVNGATITKLVTVSNTDSTKLLGFGLKAEYFANKTLTGAVATRIDKNLAFDWSNNIKNPTGLLDAFSVRWTGKYKAPISRAYYFCVDSDDGARVWLNNVKIIDVWNDHANKRDCSAAINLTQDQVVNLKVEYYENAGYAVLKLSNGSSTATANQVIIPSQDLFPE